MIDGHGDDIYGDDEVRLNFSSNVYSRFSHEGLYAHLRHALALVENYPEPTPRRLARSIAQHLHLSQGEVMVTNGATQAIYQVAQTFRGAHSAVLVPTFSEYADACRMNGHALSFVSRLGDIPLEAQLVWLCNPNNPTGSVMEKSVLSHFVKRHPEVLFVVDASYDAFTASPTLSPQEASAFPNIIMLHSMTKEFAVPGLRLGYLTANASLVAKISVYDIPWSVNQLAIEAGLCLLSHLDDYQIDVKSLLQEAARLSARLAALGIEVFPSDTHILLCRLPHGSAAELKHFLLRSHGILIRDASNFQGLDGACFRISVRTESDDDRLLKGISEWISRCC